MVEDLETATREGDIDRFCGEILSPKVVAQAERSGQKCRQQEGELRAELKRFGGKDAYDIEVKKVEVSGDEATAEVEFTGAGDKRKRSTLTLLKEGDQWGVGIKEPE